MPAPASASPPDDVLVVRGGHALHGTLAVNGAKNSVLKLLAASLLADGETVVTNVPDIADVPVMCAVLEALGVDVSRDGTEVRLRVGTPDWSAPREHVTRIRASVSVIGPLVGRRRRARIALPGGDRIGARGLDMHIRGLEELGAAVRVDDGELEVRADGLHGGDITLDFPSVGATENLLMAAVLADGRTTIDNAAREPEVVDLCHMLEAMGASIEGVGSATLVVDGVESLRPVRHATVPDRIEAGTFALMAASTGGDVTLTDVRPEHLRLPLLKLREADALVEEREGWLRVKGDELTSCDFVTLPYPGFPTDLQPQMMVLLSQARGTSICTENVFESRFSFVDQLVRMGADIEIDGHHAVIRGPTGLRGTALPALDVRAGVAAVSAGLVAGGETVVTEIHHIDRGYADFVGRLRSLGADIERVPVTERPDA